mgnify:CR=1 FL=1
MGRAERTRLDEALVARGLAPNRSAARGIIMAGLVTVSGKVSDKAGTAVADDAEIVVKQGRRYVSRGGEKLAHALDVLDIDVEGTHALDVGASTGGFVDCLLQRGATEVIALDVGRGQLDGRLREDGRVQPTIISNHPLHIKRSARERSARVARQSRGDPQPSVIPFIGNGSAIRVERASEPQVHRGVGQRSLTAGLDDAAYASVPAHHPDRL